MSCAEGAQVDYSLFNKVLPLANSRELRSASVAVDQPRSSIHRVLCWCYRRTSRSANRRPRTNRVASPASGAVCMLSGADVWFARSSPVLALPRRVQMPWPTDISPLCRFLVVLMPFYVSHLSRPFGLSLQLIFRLYLALVSFSVRISFVSLSSLSRLSLVIIFVCVCGPCPVSLGILLLVAVLLSERSRL